MKTPAGTATHVGGVRWGTAHRTSGWQGRERGKSQSLGLACPSTALARRDVSARFMGWVHKESTHSGAKGPGCAMLTGLSSLSTKAEAIA